MADEKDAADPAAKDGLQPSQGEMKVDSAYTGDDIKVLHGLEAVRLRPAMYIGDTFERGYHHCVYEIVDNSIDEAMAGYCRNISVTLGADGSCTVEDDGRGIPVDDHPEEHRPTVEVVLTVLHAGGKFEGKGYKVSGGLHGVGASCVNALSDWFVVWVKRDGKVHRERFSAGKVTHGLEVVGTCPKSETGTKVQFHLDKAIFHDDAGNGYEFVYDILATRLEELSFLNPGVHITLFDERTGKKSDLLHEDGIRGFVRSLTKNKMSLEGTADNPKPCRETEVISMSGSRTTADESVAVDVALQYCSDDYDEHLYTFANNINTHEGGTHLVGFCTALSKIVNDYARAVVAEKSAKKGGKKGGKDKTPQEFVSIEGKDIRKGLYGVISVKVTNPQFEGQTKTKLGNANVKGIVQSIVTDRLKTYFDEHPAVKTAIIEKALLEQQIREKVKKITEETRKEEGKLGKFLGKLRDCSSRNREQCELFLVEGDSAGGSATQGRDRTTQAILPLRGKVLNVQKAALDRMLANNEIRSLISAIGGGYGNGTTEIRDKEGNVIEQKPDFDVARIRYNKVVIMTDADVDGAHIRTLLLTFFYNQMRPLITHGHVYLAQPPLYGLKKGKTIEYIESDAKLTSKLIELGAKEFTLKRADGSVAVDPGKMPELTTTLAAAESLCRRLEKQRVNLSEYFARRTEQGAFPNFFVTVDIDGNPVDSLAFTADETEALKAEAAQKLAAQSGLSAEEALARLSEEDNPNFSCTPITQSETLRTHMDNLADLYGFGRDDFRGKDGAAIATLVDAAGKETEVESLLQVLELVRSRGSKGFTIQRYKGLGEMDKEQLFDTTMDPKKRKMLRVTLDDAAEADKVFSKLMGDEVAPRRRWIEENSLMAEIDA